MEPSVIIHPSLSPQPGTHETATAWVLARYYKCSIEFLQPSRGYRQKTADIVMNGRPWELKSPTGSSLSSVLRRQLRRGVHQSRYIIIDTRRTKISDVFIIRGVERYLANSRRVKSVIIITKDQKVLEL